MVEKTLNDERTGTKIEMSNGKLRVPINPIIPYIEGDGIGIDIWGVARRVLDEAVSLAYGGQRNIVWKEVLAGEKAFRTLNTWLPDDTIQTFREHLVGIKGPLTTPVGGGIRSLNVALRKELDLYACVRPVRYFNGVPSPVRFPEKVNMVVFRENTEDLYAGIEFEPGSADNRAFQELLQERFPSQYEKIRFPETSGLGIKPISKEGTERLVRSAIRYALENGRKSVTLVHKGNIMKFTEGAFRNWGYELAEREFGDRIYTWLRWQATKSDRGEEAANEEQRAAVQAGKLIINDLIADIIYERALTDPGSYDVIATMNLNGDYISDALAAQVGGMGIAPGANINFETGIAIFEATHGTAPKFAGKGVVNPGSVILSGEMMLRYMGWSEAANRIVRGMEGAIGARKVTFDFFNLMDGGELVTTSEFGDAVIEHMNKPA